MEVWTDNHEGVDYVHFKKRGESSKSGKRDTRIYAYYSDPRTRITITKDQLVDLMVGVLVDLDVIVDTSVVVGQKDNYNTTLHIRKDVTSLERKRKDYRLPYAKVEQETKLFISRLIYIFRKLSPESETCIARLSELLRGLDNKSAVEKSRVENNKLDTGNENNESGSHNEETRFENNESHVSNEKRSSNKIITRRNRSRRRC